MRRAIGCAVAAILLVSGCASITPAALPEPRADCAAWATFRSDVEDISYRVQAGVTMEQFMEMVGVALAQQSRLPATCGDPVAVEAFAAYLAASTEWSGCVFDGCRSDLRARVVGSWNTAARLLASPAP